MSAVSFRNPMAMPTKSDKAQRGEDKLTASGGKGSAVVEAAARAKPISDDETGAEESGQRPGAGHQNSFLRKRSAVRLQADARVRRP